MTDDTGTTARSLAADAPGDTVPVPANPTDAELKASLEDAEFPRASHMAKEIFGESPAVAEEE
ncbi:MAG: hypothetical protein WBG08_10875 [Litorimonas sp.]